MFAVAASFASWEAVAGVVQLPQEQLAGDYKKLGEYQLAFTWYLFCSFNVQPVLYLRDTLLGSTTVI